MSAVPFGPENMIECATLLARLGITVPVVLSGFHDQVRRTDDGWECTHDGSGTAFDNVLGVGVRWCNDCRAIQHAPHVVDDYLGYLNVVAAAVSISYIGDRSDNVANVTRFEARSVLEFYANDESTDLADIASLVLTWIPRPDTSPCAKTALTNDDFVALALMSVPYLQMDYIAYATAEAVTLGASPEHVAATALLAVRNNHDIEPGDHHAEILERISNITKMASCDRSVVVAIEHIADRPGELWWMLSPCAFISRLCSDRDPTEVTNTRSKTARMLMTMPAGIASAVSAATHWSTELSALWVIADQPLPTTQDEWDLAMILWRPYLRQKHSSFPLQHPEDALIAAHALCGLDGAHAAAVALRAVWPSTGLVLAEAIDGDAGRAAQLVKVCELCAEAGISTRTSSGALLVAVADALMEVAEQDRVALVRLAFELGDRRRDAVDVVMVAQAAVRTL